MSGIPLGWILWSKTLLFVIPLAISIFVAAAYFNSAEDRLLQPMT